MSSINKEDIVRSVLELLSKSKNSPGGVGEMVLFLEKESEGWIQGNTVDLKPLWFYCRDNIGWNESFFRELMDSLQERYASKNVQWLTPFGETDAAGLADDFASFSDSSIAAGPSDDELVEWIIEGIRRSPVERIIDPEKLRGFLTEAMEEMRVGEQIQLQLLWDVLLDADGVDEQMLIKAFLLMEHDKDNRNITLQVEYPNLVASLPDKMRASLFSSLGLQQTEQKAPQKSTGQAIDPDAYAIKSKRDTAPASGGAAPKRSTADRQARARSAKIPNRPTYNPADDSGGIPSWLLYGVVGCIVVALGLYYFVLYTPAPAWTGKPINAGPYKKIMSFDLLLLNKRTVNVKVTEKFMSHPESRRSEKAYALWVALRRSYKLHSLVIFSPKGEVVHKFDTR